MEPTLSTPASFRLGQAPLSSWQRPWKFSCSKMAIWKRAGASERDTLPLALRGGGHAPSPATGSAHLLQPRHHAAPQNLRVSGF